MRKLFTLLTALALLCAVGCEEKGDDNVDPNDKTEQPEEKPDDGSEIPDDAYISINKEVLTFSPDGESVDVKVYSNYEWTLTNNCDWVTTSVTGGEASDAGTTVTLTADLTYDDREGTITFSCGKAKKLLVVSQSFKETIIADENNVFNVPVEGGNVIINYQTSVECEVIIPEEAKSWISLAPATRALVSESATLTVAENTTYSDRSAVVKVVKVGDNTLFAEYTINQVQNDAIIADENNTFNLKGWAQSINIAYQTNVECEVIVPEEAQSWISLAPKTRALVDESVTLNIAANNTGPERSAVVMVVAANNKELVAEYTITQNQRYYIEYTSTDGYTITPNSSAFDATIIRNEYIDGKGYIDFDAPITSIGKKAFCYRSSLTSVTIPDGVTWIGYYAFEDCSSLTSITIPDSVTEIGLSAFYKCSSLTSITIPDSVTSIGYEAFRGCSSLTSVTIGDSVTSIGDSAFYWCSSLTNVTIPDSVTSIGREAFSGCTGELIINSKIVGTDYTDDNPPSEYGWLKGAQFTSLTIGDSVTSIGTYAFSGCTSLTSISIPDSVTSIGYNAFWSCSSLASVHITDIAAWCGIVFGNYYANPLYYANNLYLNDELVTNLVIPDSVTSIGGYAFYRYSSLTSITIPDSVTSIGDWAFYKCSSLTSITIPDSVTSIGYSAFWGCTSLPIENNIRYADTYVVEVTDETLTSYTLKENVRFIGSSAFSGCTSLTSITIPDSVTSIGEDAFYKCESLTSITIPDSVTSIGDWAFRNCTSLTSITIPDSVTEIGRYAFEDCTSLTSFTIPDSVTSIGDWAFRNCTSLTSITIPDSVTSIGTGAFEGCTSLTSVTIGDSVTWIGNEAFYNCTSLVSVYCKATTPPDTGSKIFSYNNQWHGDIFIYCVIYVPTESVDAYKSATYWSDAYAIVGYDF